MKNSVNLFRYIAAGIFVLLVIIFFVPPIHEAEIGVKLDSGLVSEFGKYADQLTGDAGAQAVDALADPDNSTLSAGFSGFALAKGLMSDNVAVMFLKGFGADSIPGFSAISGMAKSSSGGMISGILLFLSVLCMLAAAVFGFLPGFTRFKGLIMTITGGLGFLSYGIAILLLSMGVGMTFSLGGLVDTIASMFGAGPISIDFAFSATIFGWVALALAVIAAALAVIAMINTVSHVAAEVVGWIVGMTGMYAGAEFPIESGEGIVIGRDAALCHIVVDTDAEKVSREHVGISFDEDAGMYTVVDYSSNGTYENNGNRLEANTPVALAPGSLIYLAKPTNSFMLS